MKFTPSVEQRKALDLIKDWFLSHIKRKQRFILTGVAGSGKSSLLQMLGAELGLSLDEIAFVAFTGKASLVLDSKGIPASTIHRLIYIPIEVPDPDNAGEFKIEFKKRPYDQFPESIRLICVDEASMVNNEMQDDLERYGVPVLYVGDHFQLPPINGECRIFTEADFQLNQIHRQAEGNPIIQVSRMIRDGKNVPFGVLGNCFLKIRSEKMEKKQYQIADQILCGKNITRRRLNEQMRDTYTRTGELPVIGDKVINLRNDWDKGLVNGQIGTVTYIHDVNEKRNNICLDFLTEDGTPFRDLNCEISSFTGRKFEARWDGVKRLQMDFAYAITVHKSQGSQWDRVIVLEECFSDWDAHQRWIYTAVTRAAKKLIWCA